LALWLDAEDAASITLNGSTVSQWADKSGNGRNVAQATATNQPTYQALGWGDKPSLYFDGTNDRLAASVAAQTFASGFSVFAVLQKQGAATTYESLPVTRSITGPTLSFDGFNSFRASGSATATTTLTNSATSVATLTNKTLLGYTFVPTQYIEYINASASTNVSGAYVFNDVSTNLTIASRVDGVTAFRGIIGEIVMTVGVVSTTTRQQIEGYLAWKWKLQANLPSGHPFKNLPPTV
jgi:hypothetical protein